MGTVVGERVSEPEIDEYGQTWTQAWDRYFNNHPETLAVWGKANGRWPNCPCALCDPDEHQPRPNIFEA